MTMPVEKPATANNQNDSDGRELPRVDIVSADGLSNEQLPIIQTLAAHQGEKHAIILHDFPDPDAISAGYAYQLISAAFDIQADIIFNGRLSHRQNIAMVRLLSIDVIRYDPALDLAQYDGAVFVDNQGTSAETILAALEAANVPILIVIDHHEPQNRLSPEFADIRKKVGASATIFADYLEQGLISMERLPREPKIMLATALLHGIMTDTNNFTRAGATDFKAAGYLSQFSDSDILGQIMSQSRSRQVMAVIQQALSTRIIAQSLSIASIGYLRAEDRDAIPQAADFLLTEENIHTAIVYGIMIDEESGREAIIGSLRTSKITFDPDSFIKETFGKDWHGDYFGGGKPAAGAFEIPIGFLAGSNYHEDYKQLKWQVYDQQIKQKLFAKMGIKPD